MNRRIWRGKRSAARHLGIAVAAALLTACGGTAPAAPKPKLLVLTSLPLLFPEGFSLEAAPAPLIEALGENYDIAAIGATDPQSLTQGKLLLLAQPRAQTAENLVALDRWVRDGGRLLVFADPRLEWPSELPLGDVSRPPPMFADTGLLGHWGLRLDAPDKPGSVEIDIAGDQVRAQSPGRLVKTGEDCAIEADGLLARCGLGQGQVVVVADADLLDIERHGSGNREAVAKWLDWLSR